MMNWYEIEWPNLPRGTLICDATPLVSPMWAGPMLSILEQLSTIPEPLQPEAVYLGAETSTSLHVMFATANVRADATPDLNRGGVLGPWLCKQTPKPTIIVTMFGTEILDWADWAVPAWFKQIAVYRFYGDTRVSPTGFTEWEPDTPIETLKDFLTDAVKELVVRTSGGVFTDWSEGTLGRDPSELRIVEPRNAVRVCCYHPDGVAPHAELVRHSGEQVQAIIKPIESITDVEVIPITHVESLLMVWSRGMAGNCKVCHSLHPPGQARCATGDGLLFPDLSPDRLYTFRKQRDHWTAEVSPRGVILLADGSTALQTQTGITKIDTDAARHTLPVYFQQTLDGGYLVRT